MGITSQMEDIVRAALLNGTTVLSATKVNATLATVATLNGLVNV
jgi:hypothetical protein